MDFLKLKTILATSYYSVPDYQRDYEWTNVQNSTLCEDIFSLFHNGDNHFIGAIVTIPFEENNSINMSIDLNNYGIEETNVKHVVDGQQRLTSLSIFIKATIDSIKEELSISDSEKTKLRDKLIKLLNGDDYNNDDLTAPRLLLNGNTGKVYNKYILGNQISEPSNRSYKGAKRLLSAYDLFKKEINVQKNDLISNNVIGDALSFYKSITKIIIDRIEFVEIECPESSNAFQVFDSLNGKGLDLTAADRIKNIFMSWSPTGKGAQKWESIENEMGSDYLTSFFVSLFFLLEKKRIAKNKLPDEFRNHFREEAQTNYDGFFNSLKLKANIYGELKKSKTGKKQINDLLEDLSQLGNDQIYVMLFCAVTHYDKDIIKTSKFIDYVKALTNLVVRMQICEKTTNKLDSMFSKYIKLMVDDGKDINVITNEIRLDMKNMTPDDEFERCFANYAPNDNGISEYYLRYLENYMRIENSGNRTGVKRKEATVEHIIPQTLDDLKDWYGDYPIPEEIKEDFNSCYVERIGNKALLFSDDNTSASNDPYLNKVEVYKNGMNNQTQGTPYDTFEMIKEVVDTYNEKFNHEEIEERSRKLAELAVKIWS